MQVKKNPTKKKLIKENKKTSNGLNFFTGFYSKTIFLGVVIFILMRAIFGDLLDVIGDLNKKINDLNDVRIPNKIFKELERASENPLTQEQVDLLGNIILKIYKNDVERILKPLKDYTSEINTN